MADRKILESQFQHKLIKRIKSEFGENNVIVLKNDPDYIQGIPDLTILGKNRWALLECKRDSKASHQPNQDYYIEKAHRLSYGKFIYPENEDDILEELHRIIK